MRQRHSVDATATPAPACCIHACMYVCMPVFIYVCMYVCSYSYICMPIFLHVCMYAYDQWIGRLLQIIGLCCRILSIL